MKIKKNSFFYNQTQEFQFSFKYPIHFFSVNNQNFLISQNATCDFNFLPVTKGSYFQKSKTYYSFKYFPNKESYLSFLNFQKVIIRFLKIFNKRFKKQLIIKGLGMRIRVDSNVLELKLGFSNLLYVTIPSNLKIFRSKNLLIIEGFDQVLVGNFSFLIRKLKYPDSYQGKGLWFKNELTKLKPVKKV